MIDIYIDFKNEVVVGLNATKDSKKLKDLKQNDNDFIFMFKVSGKIGRLDIFVNVKYFGLPDEAGLGKNILTATEYLERFEFYKICHINDIKTENYNIEEKNLIKDIQNMLNLKNGHYPLMKNGSVYIEVIDKIVSFNVVKLPSDWDYEKALSLGYSDKNIMNKKFNSVKDVKEFIDKTLPKLGIDFSKSIN